MDRGRVEQAFKNYTNKYDVEDGKISLKIDHTYRVAKLSDRISDYIGLNSEDADIAWLIGMLHDIGRFEQVRRYGTFIDSRSVDHAELSADLLFNDGLISDFCDFPSAKLYDECIIESAIRAHNKYRIPSEYDERKKLFSKIIRDADKIDILKVNVEIPQEVIYDVTTEELMNAEISEDVIRAFNEGHCVLRSLKKTPMDNLVGHLSLIFELEFGISYRIVKEQGYYLKALDIMASSNNSDTRKMTVMVKEKIEHLFNQNMV